MAVDVAIDLPDGLQAIVNGVEVEISLSEKHALVLMLLWNRYVFMT